MPFPTLPAILADVRHRIDSAVARGGHDQSVTIVAVTKTFGPDAPMAAFTVGLADVGENKVQEALDKIPLVPAPLRWHLIGHLQRNKVKFVDPFVLVHGMDSPRLAEALHTYGVQRGRPVPVLLQVNVSGESTKGGVSEADVPALALALRQRDGLDVQGVMTMAPFDAPDATLRATFGGARRCRDRLREAGLPAQALSMGMSGDFELAVEEGATMVRLGSILFGARTQ